MALLIGNWDYNGNGQLDTERSEAGDGTDFLPDLRNPCSDVEAIEAQLLLLRWQSEEIIKVCNAGRLEMMGLLDDFVARFSGADDPLGFIYYSGHGLQIRSANYIFGIKDVVDIKRTADLIERRPRADPLPASGVDIVSILTLKLGRVYSGTLLLALDACRDNPVLDYIRNQRKNLPVTAPQPAKELQGMVIAYSTTAGNTADDGSGNTSPFAEVFSRAMKPDASLDEVINAAAFDLDQQTADTDRWQTPSRQGTFRPPPRCFSQDCGQLGLKTIPARPVMLAPWTSDRGLFSRAAGSAPLQTHAAASDAVFVRAAMQATEAPTVQPPPEIQPKPQMVYESATITRDVTRSVRSLGVRIDVLWCKGSANSATNESRANQILGQISELTQKNSFAGQEIGTVWITPLTDETNRTPGFGYSDNIVTYSFDDPRSAQLAHLIKGVAGADFSEDPYLENSPSLITVYVCDAALDESRPTLYFHIPKGVLEPYARTLLDDVRSNIPDLTVATGIEIVGSSPRSSQVRYFRAEDAAMAEKIASRLQDFATIPITPALISGYENKARPGLVEVWLGETLLVPNGSSQR